jgi:hypothetical protein
VTEALGCVKDPLAQQIEACSAIPLPFDEFESGDLSLSLALAPDQGQSRQHCSLILIDPSYKGMQMGEREALNRLQPAIKLLFPFSLTQHVGKLLHHLIGQIYFGIQVAKLDESLLLLLRQLFRSAQEQPGRLV